MANVSFTCPKCGQTYEFAAHLAGKRGRCKVCQAVFRIPAEEARQPGPSAPTDRTSSSAPVGPPAPFATRPAALAASPASDRPRPASPRDSSPAPPSRPVSSVDEGKIVFNCPTCGHGYRLDTRLAGKQGRCTACRGVFTIPARTPGEATTGTGSRTSSIASPARAPRTPDPVPGPVPASSTPAVPPAAVVAAGDSEWWALDSSESMPVDAACFAVGTGSGVAASAGAAPRSGSRWKGAAAAAGAGSVPAATEWTTYGNPDSQPMELPTEAGSASPRPAWMIPAAIAGGVVTVGLLGGLFLLTRGSNTPAPASSTVEQALAASSSPPPVAPEASETSPASGTRAVAANPPEAGESLPPRSPEPAARVASHVEAAEALARAYNEIADGYALIRDPDSIEAGREQVAKAVEQLKETAVRGRRLPALSRDERAELFRRGAPALVAAIERVLGELRRLKGTPGIRSDFDRLIDGYTRVRQEIQQDLEGI